MHNVQYVTVSMCRVGVGKTFQNAINTCKCSVLWSSVMNSGGPRLGYRRGADVQGKDGKKHYVHGALNSSFVAESRVDSR